jgi:hypothetical protein
MHEQKIKVKFHSTLAELMAGFLREGQTCGYQYKGSTIFVTMPSL